MSFILDALKKADEARHPATPSSPGKFRVPRLTARSARWPWVLSGIVLLAVNGGVIGYLAWPRVLRVVAPARDPRPATAQSPRASEVDAPAHPPAPLAPAPTSEGPAALSQGPTATAEPAKPGERSSAPMEPARQSERLPAPVDRPPVPALAVKPIERPVPPPLPDPRSALAPTPLRPTPPPAVLVPSTPPRQAPAPPSSGPSGTQPIAAAPSPTVAPPHQLPAEPPRSNLTKPAVTTPRPPPAGPGGGDEEFSKLKLTVHVWADKPAERLVFINGRKYVQGDRIEDKALLEEITQEGALVSYQGRRSLLRP